LLTNLALSGLAPGTKEHLMGEPRPKLKVMSLTDAAAARVRVILEKAERPAVGLRVGITKGGCAGMTYKVEYAENVKPGDEVIEDKGVRVIVDPSAVLFLLGTEMDYKVDKLSAQFVFKNPNETSACGCGESVQLTPASETGVPAS
jgi:iron-sulfur cluster assembly protein